MPVDVNPLLVRISTGGGQGNMVGPVTPTIDGDIVEWADIYGTKTRDSGVKTANLVTQAQLSLKLPWVNVKDMGAIGDGTSHPLSAYYANLALAQVDFPQATSLSEERDGAALKKAIQYCIDNRYATIYTPNSTGYYRYNTLIDFPYIIGGRNGYINFVGDGGSADNSVSPTWVAAANGCGFRFIGRSLAVTGFNALINRVNVKGVTIHGGWNIFNVDASQPVIDAEAGYEFFWDDAVVTESLAGMFLREVMDSRFNNLRITWCGQKNGYYKAMTMTSGSPTVTVASTVGLYAGMRVFGTGVGTMRISSITNSTTMVMTANANFTGTRNVAFELKAALTITNTNGTFATSNNQVWSGFRIENGAGVGLRIQGQNIIDIFMSNCKIENNGYAMDYMADIEAGAGVYIDNMWVFSSPANQSKMEYPITTAGKTLATALSATIDTFTIAGAFQTGITGTATAGSAIITGLADTSAMFVGQSVDGFNPFNFLGTYIQSVDSPTQITITENAQASGTKTLTFSIYWNFGVFYTRMMSPGMPMIAYDTTDPRNYMLCRVTDYVTGTGVVTLHVLNVFGDTAKSITSWKLASVAPGMVRIGGGISNSRFLFQGGQTATDVPSGQPYLLSFVHLDGTDGIESVVHMNTGSRSLPWNSWQAMRSTSTVTQGTGSKTFTIQTGLPADYFPVNEPVYISVDTTNNAQNQMEGTVTSYNSGTGALVCNITSSSGSGTYTAWRISPQLQPLHLQTGTNTNLSLTEKCLGFGSPAPSSHPLMKLTDDFKTKVNRWTGQQYAGLKTLVDAASVVWDLNVAQAAIVTLGGNRTLANPTNIKAGASYTLIVKQDATGSRTLAFDTLYKWPGGVIPALTATANAVDILVFTSDGTNMYGAIQNAFA